MTVIRQSTARTILVGPVLDSDGAAKTDEIVGSIKVTKNGTVGAADGSTTLTHDHAGKYKLAMDAGDSDTVGLLEISLNSGTNDMPVKTMNVVEEAVFDALFAASATGYSTHSAADVGALIGPNVHGADCYYVDSDRADDTGNGLTWSTAKKTIGAAVSAASSGDTIIVGQGSYVETSTITIAAGDSLRIIGSGDSVTSLDNTTTSPTISVLGVLDIRGMWVNSGDLAIYLNHANARLRAYDCRFESDDDVGVQIDTAGGVAMLYRCFGDGVNDAFDIGTTGVLLFADGIIQSGVDGILSTGQTLVTGTLLDCDSNDLRQSAGNLYASGCGYDSTSGTILDDDADILVDTGTTIPALIGVAQADLDEITGTGGVLIGTDVMDRSGTLDVNTKTITNGIIVAATLGADCITAAKIADDAFVAANFATGCLTADAFAADALVAATFATGAFTADAFAANALVAATFAASSLDGKGDWNTTVPDAAGTVPVDGTLKVDIETIKTQAVTCAAGVTVGVYVGSTAAAAIASDVTTAHSTTDGLITTVDTVVDGIKSVTDNLPDSGALNDLAAILTDTGVIGTGGVGLNDLGGMSDAMKAEILSEVNDALDAAISELGVAAPSATPTLRTGLMLLYMALRNKLIVQTSGTDALELHNNAGTKIASKLLTDDGDDYTEAEMS